MVVREFLFFAPQGFAAHSKGLTLASAIGVEVVAYVALVAVLWAGADFP